MSLELTGTLVPAGSFPVVDVSHVDGAASETYVGEQDAIFQAAAEATSSADATSKANTAESNAISTASSDATNKANAVRFSAPRVYATCAAARADSAIPTSNQTVLIGDRVFYWVSDSEYADDSTEQSRALELTDVATGRLVEHGYVEHVYGDTSILFELCNTTGRIDLLWFGDSTTTYYGGMIARYTPNIPLIGFSWDPFGYHGSGINFSFNYAIPNGTTPTKASILSGVTNTNDYIGLYPTIEFHCDSGWPFLAVADTNYGYNYITTGLAPNYASIGSGGMYGYEQFFHQYVGELEDKPGILYGYELIATAIYRTSPNGLVGDGTYLPIRFVGRTEVATNTQHVWTAGLSLYSATPALVRVSVTLPIASTYSTDATSTCRMSMTGYPGYNSGTSDVGHDGAHIRNVIYRSTGPGVVIHPLAQGGFQIQHLIRQDVDPLDFWDIYLEKLVEYPPFAVIDLGRNGATTQYNTFYLLQILIGKLRRLFPDMPIILLTSHDDGIGNRWRADTIRLAQSVERVVCIDTNGGLPSLAEMTSLGWMGDTAHMTLLGNKEKCKWINGILENFKLS